MTAQQTTPHDAFEAALSQHLKTANEAVPPRLAIAVDQAVRGTLPTTDTRWTGRWTLRPSLMMTAASLLFVLVLAVGTIVFLSAPPDGQPANLGAPAASSPAASDAPVKPESTPQTVTLDDGTVLDAEVVAVLDRLVAETETDPDPTASPVVQVAPEVLAVEPELVATLRAGVDPAGLVQGPRGGAVYIDRESGTVMRVNLKNGKTADIVHEGDKQKGTDRTIEKPAQLAAAGPDVVIVDDTARPWRWRPSNSAGAGTLARLTLQGRANFESNHGDVEAYDGVGDYRMYVAEPSLNQVMRYQQTFDGSAFSEPSPYLASQTAEVADFDQIYIDFDVYALFDNSLRRHTFGKYDGTFMLEQPPGASDPDYRLVAGSGRASDSGRVYLYDARHDRIVGFDKADGGYIGQWAPSGDGSEMTDVRGMYVIEGGTTRKGKRKDDALVWVTPIGIYRAGLVVG